MTSKFLCSNEIYTEQPSNSRSQHRDTSTKCKVGYIYICRQSANFSKNTHRFCLDWLRWTIQTLRGSIIWRYKWTDSITFLRDRLNPTIPLYEVMAVSHYIGSLTFSLNWFLINFRIMPSFQWTFTHMISEISKSSYDYVIFNNHYHNFHNIFLLIYS